VWPNLQRLRPLRSAAAPDLGAVLECTWVTHKHRQLYNIITYTTICINNNKNNIQGVRKPRYGVARNLCGTVSPRRPPSLPEGVSLEAFPFCARDRGFTKERIFPFTNEAFLFFSRAHSLGLGMIIQSSSNFRRRCRPVGGDRRRARRPPPPGSHPERQISRQASLDVCCFCCLLVVDDVNKFLC